MKIEFIQNIKIEGWTDTPVFTISSDEIKNTSVLEIYNFIKMTELALCPFAILEYKPLPHDEMLQLCTTLKSWASIINPDKFIIGISSIETYLDTHQDENAKKIKEKMTSNIIQIKWIEIMALIKENEKNICVPVVIADLILDDDDEINIQQKMGTPTINI